MLACLKHPRTALIGGFAILWVASHPLPSAADVSPLGQEEAVALALANQPQLAAQEAGITALREEAVAARQLPDPKLTLGVEGLPVNSLSLTREDMTQTVLGLSQMIPGGEKLAVAGRRLDHQASRGEHQLQADRRRIARDSRLAWLDVYWPDAAIALVTRIEAEYARQEDWARVAYTTGRVSQDEGLALRAMLESTRNRIAELEGMRARARAGLARWIGDAAARPPTPDLGATAAAPSLPELTAGLDAHPELRTLQTGLDVGRAEAEMSRQEIKPDWGVDLSYGIRGDGRVDTLKLMVGIDLPLFPKQRQDRRVAARLAEVAGMEAMLEDRRRMLAGDLAATHAEWYSADVRLARLEKDILPLTGQRIESALAAYKSGTVGYDRVLEARRAHLEARLDELALTVARAKAAAMLKYFE